MFVSYKDRLVNLDRIESVSRKDENCLHFLCGSNSVVFQFNKKESVLEAINIIKDCLYNDYTIVSLDNIEKDEVE
jgi:hypothetical protein